MPQVFHRRSLPSFQVLFSLQFSPACSATDGTCCHTPNAYPRHSSFRRLIYVAPPSLDLSVASVKLPCPWNFEHAAVHPSVPRIFPPRHPRHKASRTIRLRLPSFHVIRALLFFLAFLYRLSCSVS